MRRFTKSCPGKINLRRFAPHSFHECFTRSALCLRITHSLQRLRLMIWYYIYLCYDMIWYDIYLWYVMIWYYKCYGIIFNRSWFHDERVKYPPEWEEELGEYLRGSKNIEAEKKQNGEIKAIDGKEPLPFSSYEALCKVWDRYICVCHWLSYT